MRQSETALKWRGRWAIDGNPSPMAGRDREKTRVGAGYPPVRSSCRSRTTASSARQPNTSSGTSMVAGDTGYRCLERAFRLRRTRRVMIVSDCARPGVSYSATEALTGVNPPQSEGRWRRRGAALRALRRRSRRAGRRESAARWLRTAVEGWLPGSLPSLRSR